MCKKGFLTPNSKLLSPNTYFSSRKYISRFPRSYLQLNIPLFWLLTSDRNEYSANCLEVFCDFFACRDPGYFVTLITALVIGNYFFPCQHPHRWLHSVQLCECGIDWNWLWDWVVKCILYTVYCTRGRVTNATRKLSQRNGSKSRAPLASGIACLWDITAPTLAPTRPRTVHLSPYIY